MSEMFNSEAQDYMPEADSGYLINYAERISVRDPEGAMDLLHAAEACQSGDVVVFEAEEPIGLP